MRKNLVLGNIRELNRVSSINYLIYTRLLVHVTLPLAYFKGYILSLRSTCVKHDV